MSPAISRSATLRKPFFRGFVRRAPPNHSVEPRPNGKPPGPPRGRCLSSARRAWRLTAGPASPQTLGVNQDEAASEKSLLRYLARPALRQPWRCCFCAARPRGASPIVVRFSAFTNQPREQPAVLPPTARGRFARRVASHFSLATVAAHRPSGAPFTARSLTIRSSRGPTACHQARPAAFVYHPHVGPGVSPLAPAHLKR